MPLVTDLKTALQTYVDNNRWYHRLFKPSTWFNNHVSVVSAILADGSYQDEHAIMKKLLFTQPLFSGNRLEFSMGVLPLKRRFNRAGSALMNSLWNSICNSTEQVTNTGYLDRFNSVPSVFLNAVQAGVSQNILTRLLQRYYPLNNEARSDDPQYDKLSGLAGILAREALGGAFHHSPWLGFPYLANYKNIPAGQAILAHIETLNPWLQLEVLQPAETRLKENYTADIAPYDVSSIQFAKYEYDLLRQPHRATIRTQIQDRYTQMTTDSLTAPVPDELTSSISGLKTFLEIVTSTFSKRGFSLKPSSYLTGDKPLITLLNEQSTQRELLQNPQITGYLAECSADPARHSMLCDLLTRDYYYAGQRLGNLYFEVMTKSGNLYNTHHLNTIFNNLPTSGKLRLFLTDPDDIARLPKIVNNRVYMMNAYQTAAFILERPNLHEKINGYAASKLWFQALFHEMKDPSYVPFLAQNPILLAAWRLKADTIQYEKFINDVVLYINNNEMPTGYESLFSTPDVFASLVNHPHVNTEKLLNLFKKLKPETQKTILQEGNWTALNAGLRGSHRERFKVLAADLRVSLEVRVGERPFFQNPLKQAETAPFAANSFSK